MDPLIGAAIISTAGNLVSSGLNFASGNYSLNKQIEASKKMAKWQATQLPALQRQGYENAGYNPLLMFGAQPVHPQSFDFNGQNLDVSGAFSKISDAITAKEQAKNMKEYNDAVVDNAKQDVANKKVETQIRREQLEEMKRNNSETNRITEDRNRMNHVIDLLRQRIDYIRSGAGTTRTSISIPGFYNRSEQRDNSDASGTIHALDQMIQKYGEGSYDALDRDIQFDTLLGGQSAIERDIAKYNRDREERARMRVIDESDPRHFQMVEHAKQQVRLQKEQKRKERDRKRTEKINNYKVPKAPPKRSVDTYRNLYDIPGMYLFR